MYVNTKNIKISLQFLRHYHESLCDLRSCVLVTNYQTVTTTYWLKSRAFVVPQSLRIRILSVAYWVLCLMSSHGLLPRHYKTGVSSVHLTGGSPYKFMQWLAAFSTLQESFIF